MKKFRNINAALIIFALLSILTAGCGSKITVSESLPQETLPVISQDKDETKPNGSGDISSSEGIGTKDGAEDNTAKPQSTTESADASKEEGGTTSGSASGEVTEKDTAAERQTQAQSQPAQQNTKPTEKPVQTPTQSAQNTTQPSAQMPTQAPTQPVQTPTQTPTQPTAPKPTQSPTQAPTQAPTQPQSSVTLPITVSDIAIVTADSIVSRIVSSGMSEFDKVKAIHDYIVVNVDYPTYIDMNNRSLFTAEGALVNKLAVCQGYAEAFSLLCYRAGIQTEVVYGTANNGQTTESHAWNLVRIDGIWYQIDTTWDDPITQNTAGGANLRYSYFLITDSIMAQDHSAERYTKQYACTDTKYIEYGEKQTVAMMIKQDFGDIKYDFASGEAEVRRIASANSAEGVKNYAVVFDMGQKLNENNSQTVNAKINDIFNWIADATDRYSSISFQTVYQQGLKYVIIYAAIQ